MKGYISVRKSSEVFSFINGFLLDLAVPMSISVFWNFGILLGVVLAMQIVGGLLLSMHYHNGVVEAFDSVCFIQYNVNWGWVLRAAHMNGASFFFFFIYVHMGRGLYYGSYTFIWTWMIGVSIFVVLMATAFMGYVLPYGQMSYWGATVITNLISAIPYAGYDIVNWVWGGFSVGDATVMRFFVFHFLAPFLILLMVIIHLIYLHESGSGNGLGVKSGQMKVRFHVFFMLKDAVGIFFFLLFFFMIVLKYPNALGDCENFFYADPMSTPAHIKPEWYFLWAYAILRSIPSKVGGVVMMGLAIMVLYTFVLFKSNFQGVKFYKASQMIYWLLVINMGLLTWIGMRPVEGYYYICGQIFTFLFFFLFMLYFLSMTISDKIFELQ
uniref:Cytochrome b n=1 Tax=Setaphyes kielensis TaxID=3298910 RepID=A0A1I9VTT0_9BILA|nr:cytochrome b [Pycnophyes kielensis]APA17403.1 cytochrome b [Pycnophyes kielensis]